MESNRPSVAQHQSSETSSIASGGIKRTDTIDGVINAWSAPLKFAPKQGRIDESRPQSSGSLQESPKERIVEVVKEVTKVVDPYEDMEPEYKASLKRYAEMLRREAAAETDEQKFSAFEAFIKKELRLRAMLYGMDSPLQLIKSQERGAQSNERTKDAPLPAQLLPAQVAALVDVVKGPTASAPVNPAGPDSVKAKVSDTHELSKALGPKEELAEPQSSEAAPDSPPKPVNAGLNLAALAARLRDSPVQSSPQKEQAPVVVNGAATTSTNREEWEDDDDVDDDDDDDDQQFSPGGRPLPKTTSKPDLPASRAAAGATEEAYSPGGRPIALNASTNTNPSKPPTVPELTIPTTTQPLNRPTILSPGANAPMVLSDYIMPGHPPTPPSPGANAPMLVEPSPQSASANAPIVVSPAGNGGSGGGLVSKRSSTASATKKFEPDRPAYTPFRYAPAVQGPSMPADKSYESLRREGVESGRFLKHDATMATTAAVGGGGIGPGRIGTPMAGSGASTPGGLVVPSVAALQAGGVGGPGGGGQGGRKMQDEAFIGLIRMQSKAVRGGGGGAAAGGGKPSTATPPPIAALRPGTPAAQRAGTPGAGAGGSNPTARPPTPAAVVGGGPVRAPTPVAPGDLTAAVAALRAALPETVPDSYGLSKHEGVNTIKAKVDAMVDQFGFIHQTVLEWDKRNRVLRKKLDEERSQRQAESEARIDDLFNDNEIGYADIGELEAEFKLAEAKLKYEEDKAELDSFTAEVFDGVAGRLRGEVEELGRGFERAVWLLDEESEAAGRCLERNDGEGKGAPEMGIVMNLVLGIFNKMEVRHQKLTEAAVERERRRKRLELTVLYTNGDTAGVKRLESEFATAERMQVLQEARAKDARANALMDAFDRATVRGLGDNQGLVDELLPRIRPVREFVVREDGREHDEAVLYGPEGVRETLALAQKAVDLVLADSQKLLTIENVADKILNDADYGVSVAEARVSDADRSTYQKLDEEKAKEDAKIVEDTGSRMSAVGKGPGEAVELIREVVARIGDDPEHQARIRRALEAARRRNEGG